VKFRDFGKRRRGQSSEPLAYQTCASTSADFNGDIRPDMATGNYTDSTSSSVSVLLNDGSG
jgi:hypothetical protein